MKKLLLLFFFIMFVVGTDTFLLSPLLPKLKVLFHVQTDISGWMVGAYALGYTIFALLIGPLSDRRDRKTLMVIGLVAFAISTALCGFATGFWTMVTFRFLAGVSAAVASPQVWAAISILMPKHLVVRGMGVATAGLGVAQALGVPIGSGLASMSWETPFFVIALASLGLAFLARRVLPDMKPTVRESVQMTGFQSYRNLLQTPKAIWLFSAYFLFQMGNFGRFSYIGIWLSDRFDIGVTYIGLVMLWFGVGNMIGSLVGGRIIQNVGQSCALFGGMVTVTLISVIIPDLPSTLWVDIAWMATSFTFGVMFPLMMFVLQQLSPNARGTIASLSNALMYAGSTIGTAIGGYLYAAAGGFTAVSFFTCACFLASLGSYRMSRVFQIQRNKVVETSSQSA